jgi:glycosyltransferase involved in cell wall biosynthesis
VLQTTAIETLSVDDTYAWDIVPGTDGFRRITLFDEVDTRSRSVREIARRAWSALNEVRPEVVIVSGWSLKEALIALHWCAEFRAPAVLMSETTEWDDVRLPWKEWVKSRMVRLCSAGLVGGAPHVEYLTALGMDHDRIFVGYDIVDNNYFAAKAQEVRNRRADFRKQYGLPDRYFLASARFVRKKNLRRLIQAYGHYRRLAGADQSGKQSAINLPWDLVLMGDGPFRPELCQLISDLGLQHSVLLPGFRQYVDLPAYYGLASAFIHASTTEQWGLVVNEAMASDLPVLVSDRCGCARDLVREGVNGFTFDPYNVQQMAELMLRMANGATGEIALKKMGDASHEIIRPWGPERFAQGLQAAVETALQHPRPQIELLDRVLLRGLIYK